MHNFVNWCLCNNCITYIKQNLVITGLSVIKRLSLDRFCFLGSRFSDCCPLFTVFFFLKKKCWILKDTRNFPRLIGVRMTRVSVRTGSTIYFSLSQCFQHFWSARKGVMLLSLAAWTTTEAKRNANAFRNVLKWWKKFVAQIMWRMTTNACWRKQPAKNTLEYRSWKKDPVQVCNQTVWRGMFKASYSRHERNNLSYNSQDIFKCL